MKSEQIEIGGSVVYIPDVDGTPYRKGAVQVPGLIDSDGACEPILCFKDGEHGKGSYGHRVFRNVIFPRLT